MNMVDNSQGTGSSPGSSIPCAQKSPEQQTSQTSTGMSTQSNSLHHTLQVGKMLHKGSLLQQTNRHLSKCLLHPSNSHHCYSPQPQAHMLPQHSRVSHNLYSQWLCKVQPCHASLGYPFYNMAAHTEATPTREGI